MFYYKHKELGVTRVEKPEQMPAGEHWAILIFETTSTYVPGDERSRTAPGHGYPAHYETNSSFQYWACADKSALERALNYMRKEHEREAGYRAPKPYVIIHARRAEVRTKVEVEIS